MIINGQFIKYGININDSTQAFTEQILEGLKDIETRAGRNVFKSIMAERVALVRTGCGKPEIVGLADLTGYKIYRTAEQFHADDDRHLVHAGSKFDIKPDCIKYGYVLDNIERCEPTLAPTGTGNRSYRII